MELSKYLNKYVKIDLNNSKLYYKGRIISVDEDSISLIDITGKNVTISKNSIAFIREEKR